MPRIATVRDLSLSIAGALLAAVLLGCGQQTPPPAATSTGATLPTPRPTVTLAHTTPEPVPQRLTLCTLEPGAVSPFLASDSAATCWRSFSRMRSNGSPMVGRRDSSSVCLP